MKNSDVFLVIRLEVKKVICRNVTIECSVISTTKPIFIQNNQWLFHVIQTNRVCFFSVNAQ